MTVVTAFILQSCHSGPATNLLNTAGEAVSPYLTMDEAGVPVLCWTEKNPDDSAYSVKFARYQEDTGNFGPAVTVAGSEGAQTAAESMNKVAFRSDGSVVAVFGKKFRHEKNPYAGAIYYCLSGDFGKTWSDPAFLHSDTLHHYGRGFFDLARMADGEIAAVWLDGRLGRTEKGSALYFNRTAAGKGFGIDRLVDKNTCECCRTELLADQEGALHVSYRKILYPAEKLGKPVRDMVYTMSGDNGSTFSAPELISRDGWVLDGCPHTGPSVAMAGGRPSAIWFTAGGEPGLYFSEIGSGRPDGRILLTRTGRHPQVVSLGNGRLAAAWEEAGSDEPAESTTGHHGGHAASGSGIRVSRLVSGKVETDIYRTSGNIPRHHPVIQRTTKGLLVAWVAETEAGPRIEYVHLSTGG